MQKKRHKKPSWDDKWASAVPYFKQKGRILHFHSLHIVDSPAQKEVYGPAGVTVADGDGGGSRIPRRRPGARYTRATGDGNATLWHDRAGPRQDIGGHGRAPRQYSAAAAQGKRPGFHPGPHGAAVCTIGALLPGGPAQEQMVLLLLLSLLTKKTGSSPSAFLIPFSVLLFPPLHILPEPT